MIVPAFLGALAVGLAVLTRRSSASSTVEAGDELLVSPSALLGSGGSPAILPMNLLVEFVIVKASGPSGEDGMITGYVVSAEGIPSVNPPLGPVTVRRADVRAIVRGGRVVWERQEAS